MSEPADHCDNCNCGMKHKRIGPRRPSYLFVCEDCRGVALRKLGNDGVTCTHVGIKL
jgi:hypothetical protein